MRSKRGVLGSAIVVLCLPLADVLLSLALGDAEMILHFVLGVGVIVIASGLFAFKTTSWMTWAGILGLVGLGAVFLLQGVSDIADNTDLHEFAYNVMGQTPERILPILFFAWCVALVMQDSSGKTRIFGVVAVGLVIVLEVVDLGMNVAGEDSPGILKMFYLLLFAWLLLESSKPASASSERAPTAGPSSRPQPIDR